MLKNIYRVTVLCLFFISWTAVCGITSDLLLGTSFLISPDHRPNNPNLPVNYAPARIPIGMERAEAIQMLPEAWYHGTCDHSSSIDDVFVFGAKDVRRADVILVISRPLSDTMRVAHVGVLDDSLVQSYADCLPPDFVPTVSMP